MPQKLIAIQEDKLFIDMCVTVCVCVFCTHIEYTGRVRRLIQIINPIHIVFNILFNNISGACYYQ